MKVFSVLQDGVKGPTSTLSLCDAYTPKSTFIFMFH